MISFIKLGFCWALTLAGAWVGSVATAATVYRCGPDGRVFSDQPCPAGEVRILPSDTLSAARQAEAAQVLKREQALASSLVAERRQREKEAASRGAAGIYRPATVANVESTAVAEKQQPTRPRERRGKAGERPRTVPVADPHLSFSVKVPAPKKAPAKHRGASRRSA